MVPRGRWEQSRSLLTLNTTSSSCPHLGRAAWGTSQDSSFGAGTSWWAHRLSVSSPSLPRCHSLPLPRGAPKSTRGCARSRRQWARLSHCLRGKRDGAEPSTSSRGDTRGGGTVVPSGRSGAEGTRQGSHALKTICDVPGAKVYLVQ